MDYKDIIENLETDQVIKLMSSLGANNYIDKETHIIFPTICHNVDVDSASQKLYFYKGTKLFVCYTEGGNLSIFNFLKHYYETRKIEYNWYEDIYEVVLDCSKLNKKEGFQPIKYQSAKDRYSKIEKRKKLNPYSEKVLESFIKFYPVEWLNDGISKEAMDKFNILYSISQNKIIIPHYDVENNLVGIRGRALNEWEVENVGKYVPLCIENIWYTHSLSLNVYGLNVNKDNILKTGYCIIAEGEKSVLQAESFSRPNCVVATCGSGLNKYFLNIILRECHPQEIILAYDNEEKAGQDNYFNKLKDFCRLYNRYCNFSFIYDRQNLTPKKASPFDCGEEVFEKLLEKRVKIN